MTTVFRTFSLIFSSLFYNENHRANFPFNSETDKRNFFLKRVGLKLCGQSTETSKKMLKAVLGVEF